MADVLLTCAETPLAWPASVDLTDVSVSTTSTLNLFASAAGPQQILTRRQGGAGDGVNIVESPTVGADYRGQRYSLEEVVFHTPGLHVFPGQSAVYPAELHVHLKTFAAPNRAMTVVVPVSHLVAQNDATAAYFIGCAAQPDPSVAHPQITSLLVPGTDLLVYRGPDIRGRTADVPTPDAQCAPDAMQREFILVLNPAFIRATDLERIPREGSLSTDPRDLPAPGVTPAQAVPRDRLLRCLRLARPGLSPVLQDTPEPPSAPGKELECRPLKVVDGRDVIDIHGKAVDLAKLLGFDVSGGKPSGESSGTGSSIPWAHAALMFVGTAVGILIADWLLGHLWGVVFIDSDRLRTWEPLKLFVYIVIAASSAGFTGVSMPFLQSLFGQ